MIRPTPKQREAHKALQNHNIVLFGGAIRGGKSFWLILELFTLCFKYPRSRWVILRKDMPTLKRTILVTFQEFLNNGFQQYIKEYNQQTMTVKISNGSEIIFMAESFDTDKELNRFRGLEINGAGIDEVNEIQKVTYAKIIERSGSWNGSPGCPIRILMTCNPAQGWVKEDIYDKWMLNQLPKNTAYVPSKITDNPYISKDYLQSLKDNMPPTQYEIFVEGSWDNTLNEGALFFQEDLRRFKMADFKAEGFESILGYIDVADEGDDKMAFPIGYIFNNKVFITDVIFSPAKIDITLPLAASRINDLKINYIRVEANNQGGGFIRQLRELVEPSKILPVKNHSNKHTRILMEYMFIKKYFYFRDDFERGSEYYHFMNEIFTYMKDGTSKHDDAPDSISGLSKFIRSFLPHLFNKQPNEHTAT